MALLNVPNITPQSTPVLQDRGDPALPSLLHRTYWLFLNAMQAVSGLMASAIDTLQDAVNTIQNAGYVKGAGNLTNAGAIPKVSAAGTVSESALKDDGAVVTLLSRLFDSNKTIRSTGFQNPAAGSGVELKYDTGAGVGLIVVYDRTGAAWLPLALYGSTVSFLPQSGTTTNTGHLDLNGGGIYKIGGVSGITATITTAKLTALGANGSMTFTGGILTAQTQAT